MDGTMREMYDQERRQREDAEERAALAEQRYKELRDEMVKFIALQEKFMKDVAEVISIFQAIKVPRKKTQAMVKAS